MAVNFNAEPSPEGLALAAQVRRERLERDKALEDRIAEAEVRDLEAAGRSSEAFAASHVVPELDADTEAVDDEQLPDPVGPPTPIDALRPGRDQPRSPAAELEALAALARVRSNDRQR
ncbi:MAG: hypothetical protein DI630_00500 [Gordonia sp. (in: high G+C Gram-positive bacteria)]|nr:MAG: hypothetical protein DI630_00500 [Gordonia sp. (in: high G+C Gram-positive bacteria)]